MESLVNRIIEIDRMADGRINDAKKQSEDILKSAEEKCKKIREDITAAAEKRIAMAMPHATDQILTSG